MPLIQPDPGRPDRARHCAARRCAIAIAVATGLAAATAGAAPASSDLMPLISRAESTFRDANGFIEDSRYSLNPSEVARLTAVCQALGYYDLYRATGDGAYIPLIRNRADYVVAHVPEITSNSAFDGMWVYSLLAAFEVTRVGVYWCTAKPVIDRLVNYPLSQLPLNGGLMAAMALVKYYELTGDMSTLVKTQQIIDGLVPYVHPNGSFPHYYGCPGSTDIHYTAWMGMELITIRHTISYPRIESILSGIDGFLRARVPDNGVTVYSDAGGNYYSIGTGCVQDYDTRAWTNELGYNALVFRHFDAPDYQPVIDFLTSVTNGGVFPDKWDFLPPPSDPIYPWATSNHSVIRASIVFWSLAAIVRDLVAPPPPLVASTTTDPADFPALAAAWGHPRHATGVRRTLPPGSWSTVDSLFLMGADMNDAGDASGLAPSIDSLATPRNLSTTLRHSLREFTEQPACTAPRT